MKIPEVELELTVWQAIEYGYNKLFKRRVEESPYLVRLEDHRDSFLVFARAVSGQAVEVRAAEEIGGRQDEVMMLPPRMDRYATTEDNRFYYLFRILMMSLSPAVRPGGSPSEKMLHEATAGIRAAHRVVETYPPARDWLDRILLHEKNRRQDEKTDAADDWLGRFLELLRLPEGNDDLHRMLLTSGFEDAVAYAEVAFGRPPRGVYRCHPLFGKLYAFRGEKGKAGADPQADRREATLSDGTEIQAPVRDDVKVIHVDEERWKKKHFAPQFEATESLEEFNGSMKKMDGADEIEEQAEAMKELELREVVRSQEQAHSIFKADLMLDSGAADAADLEEEEIAGIPYPEWDARKRRYRPDWCTVYSRQARATDPAYVQSTLTELHSTYRDLERKLAAIRGDLRSRPRHTDGPEIDLDAVVDAQATIRAGHTPSDRLYLRPVRAERDVALLILLDLSLSTDGYVDGRRVLDVAKQSLIVLGEAWQAEADWFSIAGFSSRTRHSCRYLEIKGLHESWSKARQRLGAVEPEGYTRIGPAVRHGNALLSKASASKKCMLLITDGKPNDYDRYEGRHGIADVRQAVREGAQKGIMTHALAIESTAKDYLPAMLGNRNYRILPKPQMLVDSLADLFVRLRRA